jgi:hypothetical protein
MSDDESAKVPIWVKILLAVIPAAAIITVGYMQFRKPTPEPSDKVRCDGRVLDSATGQAIGNAKVIIEEAGKARQFIQTSTEGYFDAKVNKTTDTINITVEENNYVSFNRPVSTDPCSVGNILLTPKARLPVISPSSSRTPTVKTTPPPIRRRDDTEDIMRSRKQGPTPR